MSHEINNNETRYITEHCCYGGGQPLVGQPIIRQAEATIRNKTTNGVANYVIGRQAFILNIFAAGY